MYIQGHVNCSRWDRSARQPSLLPVFLELKLCQRQQCWQYEILAVRNWSLKLIQNPNSVHTHKDTNGANSHTIFKTGGRHNRGSPNRALASCIQSEIWSLAVNTNRTWKQWFYLRILPFPNLLLIATGTFSNSLPSLPVASSPGSSGAVTEGLKQTQQIFSWLNLGTQHSRAPKLKMCKGG